LVFLNHALKGVVEGQLVNRKTVAESVKSVFERLRVILISSS
jgi:hypothetical protein